MDLTFFGYLSRSMLVDIDGGFVHESEIGVRVEKHFEANDAGCCAIKGAWLEEAVRCRESA